MSCRRVFLPSGQLQVGYGRGGHHVSDVLPLVPSGESDITDLPVRIVYPGVDSYGKLTAIIWPIPVKIGSQGGARRRTSPTK